MSKWIYLKADGRFLRGGYFEPDFDATTEGLVEFDEGNPDPIRERFDATSPTNRRPATAAEIAAVAAADADAALNVEASRLDIKTTVVWTLKRILGRNPTLAEINAAKTEWIAVRKAIS
jgi:hypothetical protein